LLLAATVRSFAHMPLGISDRNSSNKYVDHGSANVCRPVSASFLSFCGSTLNKVMYGRCKLITAR